VTLNKAKRNQGGSVASLIRRAAGVEKR